MAADRRQADAAGRRRGGGRGFLDQLPASTCASGSSEFSNAPDTLLAPTTDRAAAVRQAIDAQVAVGATATGEAPPGGGAACSRRDPQAAAGAAAIVLLSDGAANAGQDPVAVATAGRARRTSSSTPSRSARRAGTLANPDPFEPAVPVPPDPQLMQADRTARRTGVRSPPRTPDGSTRSTTASACGSRAGPPTVTSRSRSSPAGSSCSSSPRWRASGGALGSRERASPSARRTQASRSRSLHPLRASGAAPLAGAHRGARGEPVGRMRPLDLPDPGLIDELVDP